MLQVSYPLEYIVGPKSSKSANKGGSGSSKKGGASIKSDSSLGSVSGTPDPDYAQALKDLKLQWLR